MKKLIIGGVIVLLAVVGYIIGAGGGSDDAGTSDRGQNGGGSDRAAAERVQRVDESLRVRGRVMSISATQVIVGTYEQGNRGGFDRSRAENMSESEREAFRAQRQAEREESGEPEIVGEKIITLTSSTEYVRGSRPGNRRVQAGGDSEAPEQEEIEFEEIAEGATVNITLKEGTQEAATVSLQQVRQ